MKKNRGERGCWLLLSLVLPVFITYFSLSAKEVVFLSGTPTGMSPVWILVR